jgi:hypothetical protein
MNIIVELTKSEKALLLDSARASKMVYRPRATRRTLESKSKPNIHLCVRRSANNKMTIAFKGTTTADEIVSFLMLKPQEFRFKDAAMHIHTGILSAFEGLEPDLHKYLYGLDVQDVTFTGHSQGGALAMLASAYFGDLSNGSFNITCHTFGAPRVGDAHFHEWSRAYVRASVNVVNRGDIVSQLPIGLGYVDNPNALVLGNLLDVVRVVRNHHMDTYIQNICDVNVVA